MAVFSQTFPNEATLPTWVNSPESQGGTRATVESSAMTQTATGLRLSMNRITHASTTTQKNRIIHASTTTQKKWKRKITGKTVEPWGLCAKWSKPIMKGQILYDSLRRQTVKREEAVASELTSQGTEFHLGYGRQWWMLWSTEHCQCAQFHRPGHARTGASGGSCLWYQNLEAEVEGAVVQS